MDEHPRRRRRFQETPTEDVGKELKKATGQDKFDAIIDCAGATEMMRLGFSRLAISGHYADVGLLDTAANILGVILVRDEQVPLVDTLRFFAGKDIFTLLVPASITPAGSDLRISLTFSFNAASCPGS